MNETTWTSISSIIFGLIAWIIPLVCIVQYKKLKLKTICISSIISFIFCAFSLFVQIFFVSIMVKLEDWSGLSDTIDVVLMVSLLLLIIALFLNSFIFILCYMKKHGDL